MGKYLITFTKLGYIKYTSHLDMLRLFKRSFKRAGISLVYSQGFNPHPSIAFGQPLSLGYESICELLEFETKNNIGPVEIRDLLNSIMPKGIEVLSCITLDDRSKSVASTCYEAAYKIIIPVDSKMEDLQIRLSNFLEQKEIMASKASKKTRDIKELDIKPKIRGLEVNIVDNNIVMTTRVDAGSVSNLSPELLIASFCEFANIKTERANISIIRTDLKY